MDLENGEFTFHATEPGIDEAEVATLPCRHPGLPGLPLPVVELTIRGVMLQGVFDTGAAYSAWMTRAQEPARPITATRTDFHVGVDGQLCEFRVLMRRESLRFGDAVLDLDLAYLPETWPGLYPDCLIGMDVPKKLGARRFTLDPHCGALRFYRRV